MSPDSVASYLGVVTGDPIIAPSAHRHGLDDADILHAYRQAIRAWHVDRGMTMIVGPAWSGALLEVGYIEADEEIVILHAMPSREKFLR